MLSEIEIIFTKNDFSDDNIGFDSPLGRIVHGEKWVRADIYPKGSDHSKKFMDWIQLYLLSDGFSQELVNNWLIFKDEYSSAGYYYGISVICDKLTEILGIDALYIANIVNYVFKDDEKFHNDWNKKRESGCIKPQQIFEKRIISKSYYSDEEFNKLVWTYFRVGDEGDWRSIQVLRPNTTFKCENSRDFLNFVISQGVYKNSNEYEKACEEYGIVPYRGSMWDILDLISVDSSSGEDVELFLRYADLNRDFAEASYTKCREYINDVMDEIFDDVQYADY